MPPIGYLLGHTNEQLLCVRDAAILFSGREADSAKRAYLNLIVAACNREESRRDAQARALFGGFVDRAIQSARQASRRFAVKRGPDKEWSRFLDAALLPRD